MSSFIINVKSPSGSWATGAGVGTIKADLGFSYSDKLSEMNRANINISGTGEVKRSLIEIGSEIKIQRGGTLEFHGNVQSIDYLEGGSLSLNVWGYELWLGRENGAYAGSPWSSTASATIFNAVIGESNYFTAGTVNAGTSVDYRAEVTDSLWNVIGDLTSATSQDIGIDYPNLEVDILDHKGSATSVKTYNAGIQLGDVRITKNYPKANKVLVYGKSEGQTRITSDYPTHGKNQASQDTYGVITHTIRDPKIITQAQANILADAEVARLKDPIKIYDFDVFNPNQDLESGDVITINALSQGVSNEDVRIVAIERGVNRGEEYLTLQVVNEAYSRLIKTSDTIMAQIDKTFRDQQTYDEYADEYANQTANTHLAGHTANTACIGDAGSTKIIGCQGGFGTVPAVGYALTTSGFSIFGGQVQINTGGMCVNMGRICYLANPVSAQDAATKCYVDACSAAAGLWEDWDDPWICPATAGCSVYVPNCIVSATMYPGFIYKHPENAQINIGDNIDMTTHKIANVVNPTANQEAATKYYVDTCVGAAAGLWEDYTDPWICPRTAGCSICIPVCVKAAAGFFGYIYPFPLNPTINLGGNACVTGWLDVNNDIDGYDVCAADDLISNDVVDVGDKMCHTGCCKACWANCLGASCYFCLCGLSKAAAIEYESNQIAFLKVEESPDVWFNDRGSDCVIGGEPCKVCFDCVYQKVTEERYNVQVTPTSEAQIYVTCKEKDGFTVYSGSDATFDWLTSKIRKGFKDMRWKSEVPYPYQMDQMNTYENYQMNSRWNKKSKGGEHGEKIAAK